MKWKRTPVSLVAFAVGWILLSSTQSSFAQLKRSDSKVKVKASASKLNDANAQTVKVHIKIDKGWHLYANPPGNEFFKNIATAMKVKGGNVKKVTVNYPKGTQKVDKMIGKYNIYEKEVTLSALVQRSDGNRSPLDVSVTLSACDAKRCLLPATIKLKVE